MTVVSVVTDGTERTVTITARFDAPVDRVWQVWSDPRQLEQWWGPPDCPATVTEHDLTPGGTVRYSMTGPDGEAHAGWWRVLSVEPPQLLEFEDGFAAGDGTPDPTLPTGRIRVSLTGLGSPTTEMVVTATWASDEALAQIIAMGTDTGMTAAVGQIDDVLTR